METQDFYDISLQLSQSLVSKIFLRSTKAAREMSPGHFKPHIIQSTPPYTFDIMWSDPQISIHNGTFHLSAQVDGYANSEKSGVSFSINGSVDASVRPIMIADTEGHPYVCCEGIKPTNIDTHRLSLIPENTQDNPSAAGSEELAVRSLLNTILIRQLLQPLSALPLTYTLSSLPLQIASLANPHSIAVEKTQAFIVEDEGSSLLVGFQLRGSSTKDKPVARSLLDTSMYNVALGISSQGMNSLLEWLYAHDQCRGMLDDAEHGHISWTFTSPSVAFLDDRIHLQGGIDWIQSTQTGVDDWTQPAHRVIDVFLLQSRDDEGNTLVTLESPSNLDPLVATIITTAWNTFLQQLLHTPPERAIPSYRQNKLYQRFSLPGMQVNVGTVAREVVVQHNQLLVYYDLPMDEKSSHVSLVSKKTLVSAVMTVGTVAGITQWLYSLLHRPVARAIPPSPNALAKISQQNPIPRRTSPTIGASKVFTSGKIATTLVVITIVGTIFGAAIISPNLLKNVLSPIPPQSTPESVASPIVQPSEEATSPSSTGGNYTIQITIGQETFTIAVNQEGQACMKRDNGLVQDRNYFYPDTPKLDVTFKSVFQCSGTYQKNGHLDFTETVVSDEIDTQLITSQNCIAILPPSSPASSPEIYIHMIGDKTSDDRLSGLYTWNFPSWDCSHGEDLRSSLDFYFQSHNLPISLEKGGQGNGTWMGSVTSSQ